MQAIKYDAIFGPMLLADQRVCTTPARTGVQASEEQQTGPHGQQQLLEIEIE